MSEHSKISGKDLSTKGFIEQTRKVGGRIVREEVHVEPFDGEDGLNTLLSGVEEDEVEAGRDTLFAEHPELAREGAHHLLDRVAESLDTEQLANELNSPVRVASTKRAGIVSDSEGDSFHFHRINANSQVELSLEDGEVIDTLANADFDDLLDSGDYIVM